MQLDWPGINRLHCGFQAHLTGFVLLKSHLDFLLGCRTHLPPSLRIVSETLILLQASHYESFLSLPAASSCQVQLKVLPPFFSRAESAISYFLSLNKI
ncbi:uncharacterized protein gng13.L isoform X1 [Xenopus laevis]|uniref:Uncharacterized protein gng13.L isoform X1 n=1 Tax=Xenopus laevis TaxID=8355 RepID=A0A8J0TWH7_XENLA|nr:uncharacterized protein gng13.L isoform X1 [Xenopus laevis]